MVVVRTVVAQKKALAVGEEKVVLWTGGVVQDFWPVIVVV